MEDAAESRDGYLAALAEIEAAKLPATVSIKLTQFGLDLSSQVCETNVLALAQRARSMQSRVEVDMESSDYTERTLDLVKRIQQLFPGHVRAVIQAYLFRSEGRYSHAFRAPDTRSAL
jgi:proline dehydrogenase